MLEHFFKSLVATVSDPYQCNRITDALAAAGIKFYCKSKDVNRQMSIGITHLTKRELELSA